MSKLERNSRFQRLVNFLQSRGYANPELVAKQEELLERPTELKREINQQLNQRLNHEGYIAWNDLRTPQLIGKEAKPIYKHPNVSIYYNVNLLTHQQIAHAYYKHGNVNMSLMSSNPNPEKTNPEPLLYLYYNQSSEMLSSYYEFNNRTDLFDEYLLNPLKNQFFRKNTFNQGVYFPIGQDSFGILKMGENQPGYKLDSYGIHLSKVRQPPSGLTIALFNVFPLFPPKS